MLRINQSNLADDEDQALDLYDEAILAFKKASALSPGKLYTPFSLSVSLNNKEYFLDNPKLSEMVNMLQALQDGAELEGEEEEDVEDEE